MTAALYTFAPQPQQMKDILQQMGEGLNEPEPTMEEEVQQRTAVQIQNLEEQTPKLKRTLIIAGVVLLGVIVLFKFIF